MKSFIRTSVAAALAFAAIFLGTLPVFAQDLFQDDPLIVAMTENKVDDVRALMVRGHPTGVRDADGRTGLIWGGLQGNYEALEILLEGRVRIDTADNYGNTALYYAAGNGHVETVELLLDHGATIDAENLEGRTPLMRAVEAGRAETARRLIERGADANHTDFTGRSVLDWAREGRSSRIVRMLEGAGAR
jgi:uncharacterized protein